MGLFDGFAGPKKSFGDLRKYVDDFRIDEVPDEKGRLRRQARYIGVWTVLRGNGPAVRVRLALVPVLGLLMAAAYIRMLTLPHMAGGQILIMLPLLAGLFPTFYLLMGAVSLPFRGRPMRRDQYMHSFIRVFRSATAAGACVLVGQLAALILRAVKGDWLFLPADWRFVASGAAVLACAGGAMGLLRSVDVTERPNSFYTPEES